MKRIFFFTLWVLLLLAPFSFAGIENRPLNSDEATVLKKSQFVIATGGLFLKQSNKDREWDWVTDVEYGIFDRLELDIEFPYRSLNYADNSSNADVRGIGDIAGWLEFKVADESEFLPTTSVAFTLKSASGSRGKGLGSGANNTQLTGLFSKNFGCSSGHINVGYSIVSNTADTDYGNSLNYNFAFEYILNKKVLLVSEIYGQRNPDKSADRDPLDILYGFVYSLSDHISMDFGLGAGLTSASPDTRITSGLTYNF